MLYMFKTFVSLLSGRASYVSLLFSKMFRFFKRFKIQSGPLILALTTPNFVKFISQLPERHQYNGLYLNYILLYFNCLIMAFFAIAETRSKQ